MSRKPVRRRRATRPNPKPRAWSTKGPSRAYPCKSPLLGRTVRLGRSEVVVESCATPSRAKPGQGQFRVRAKATGKSRAVSRRRVSAAIYRAKHPRKMPTGLLTFWAKTRGGGVPASALRRAPEKEIPAFVYDPHGPLPSAQFGPGTADVLRPDFRHLPLPSAQFGPTAPDALRPDFRHRALPSAQFGPTAPEPGRRTARPAKAKTETFAKARARILGEFKALGWDVHTRSTARGGGPLKVPYVTSRDGRQRIDFHEQSAYADGHSIESDLRGVSAASLAERLTGPVVMPTHKVPPRAAAVEAGPAAPPAMGAAASRVYASAQDLLAAVRAAYEARGVRVADKSIRLVAEALMTGNLPSEPGADYLLLGEANVNSRRVFERISGVKLPSTQKATRALFGGVPFVVVAETARDNPARWRQNHHGGWHAPGDPLGYAPRANRSRAGRRRRSR